MQTTVCADVLVSSRESHSIEWFDNTGGWISTFASTGPYAPGGLAQSSVDHSVYVANYTNTILRYGSNGQPSSFGWDTFTLPATPAGNVVESVLFDSSGDLYVASLYGEAGYTQAIYKYTKASLAAVNPSPSDVIATHLIRGDQMAFDAKGNVCIASFINEDMLCFDPITHALVFDYKNEIVNGDKLFSVAIQPVGLAFDGTSPSAPLIVTSTFEGNVDKEVAAHAGPFKPLLPSGTLPQQLLHLTLSGSDLYVPSYNLTGRTVVGGCNAFYACNDTDFNSDTVYKIDLTTGTVTSFISSHIWGPYQLIFADVTKCKPCPTSMPCLMPI